MLQLWLESILLPKKIKYFRQTITFSFNILIFSKKNSLCRISRFQICISSLTKDKNIFPLSKGYWNSSATKFGFRSFNRITFVRLKLLFQKKNLCLLIKSFFFVFSCLWISLFQKYLMFLWNLDQPWKCQEIQGCHMAIFLAKFDKNGYFWKWFSIE